MIKFGRVKSAEKSMPSKNVTILPLPLHFQDGAWRSSSVSQFGKIKQTNNNNKTQQAKQN